MVIKSNTHWRGECNRRIRAKIFGDIEPIPFIYTSTETKTANSSNGIVKTESVNEVTRKQLTIAVN